MHAYRFDTLTRYVTERRSRRGALNTLVGGTLGLLGVSPAQAAKRKGKGKKHRKHTPEPPAVSPPPPCVSQDPAVVCAAGCGTRPNNCGQKVTCPCPAGRNCLISGDCGIRCTGSGAACPTGCFCEGGFLNTEGQQNCIAVGTACPGLPKCTISSDCARGSQCQACQEEDRVCVPLCAG